MKVFAQCLEPSRLIGPRPLIGASLGLQCLLSAIILCSVGPLARAAESSVSDSLKAVAKADGNPESDRAASNAASVLQGLPSERVTEILGAFEGASQRGRNWLRSIAADVSDNGSFQQQSLRKFFDDRTNDADARYVAFQLLTQNDAESRAELLSDAATDPSLPIRYLKIKSILDRAGTQLSSNPDVAKKLLRDVISNGRSPSQLEKATKLLADLDVQVDLAEELGMMRKWWLVGPFDNTDSEHFDTVYAPEARYQDLGSAYELGADGRPQADEGKKRPATWQEIESDDSLGMVDLNEPLSNEKDAVAYVFARFKVKDGESIPKAQARLGCICASKVWVNGKLVSSNEVYHSGTRIDQYVEDCELETGENTVLIKVLQNAQTEPWAQDWQFQFRLTRPDGSAIKTEAVQ